MQTRTRRSVLGGLSALVGGSLAGCVGGEEPEPGLHVASAIVHHQRGDRRYDYPEDVGVRVNVENTTTDTLSGRVRVHLVPAASDEDADGWVKTRDIVVGGAMPQRVFVVFEDVAATGDDEFEVTATLDSVE